MTSADMTPQDIYPLVALTDHAVFSTPGRKRMTGLQSPEEGLYQATTQTAGKVYVTLGLKIHCGLKMIICVNRMHFLSMWLIRLEQAMFFTAR
ncbi:sugar kinase yihV [Escherichia coli]|nr:sugar kinase yihV [Escherichia coli]